MGPEQLERELAKYFKPMPATERALCLRMLLYGGWGVGKTKLACEVGQKPMHLVTEPSDDTLADWPELRSRVDVVEYGGVNHLKLIAEAFEKGLYPHDTLIVDTVSELIEEQLDAIKDGWKSAKDTRPKFTGKGGNVDLEVVGTDDYRLVRDALRPVVKRLCMLPKTNVIFVAHEREPTWTDEANLNKDGKPLPPMRPDLPSQTLKMIAKRVSVVGRMTRVGDKRTLSFRTDDRLKEEVKSRILELDGKRMSDVDFLRIVNAWRLQSG